MPGLFDGTPLERPVTCDVCAQTRETCRCPRDIDGRVLLPRHQTARLAMERRRGKPVTTISGLDRAATDLPALLKQLKTTCASGGTLTTEGVIELQGEHRERVRGLLRSFEYKTKG